LYTENEKSAVPAALFFYSNTTISTYLFALSTNQITLPWFMIALPENHDVLFMVIDKASSVHYGAVMNHNEAFMNNDVLFSFIDAVFMFHCAAFPTGDTESMVHDTVSTIHDAAFMSMTGVFMNKATVFMVMNATSPAVEGATMPHSEAITFMDMTSPFHDNVFMIIAVAS
jgi:hypothetical protein